MARAAARKIVGLMSGTSADGVDAVLCLIDGRGAAMRARVVAHVGMPYPPNVRAAILRAAEGEPASAADFCRLNWRVGDLLADAAAEVLRRAGVKARQLACVASHGQTICHLPPRGARGHARVAMSGTWQIGEPAVLAGRLRVPVVSRFREADIAAGGQGAPLVPWTDWVLLRHRRVGRVVQNVGGIANLTWLPAGRGAHAVRAFDSGPGNMVIDALVQRFSGGRAAFDRNGAQAARGKVVDGLLRHWLRHPYFRHRPPKSCGREEFGAAFVAAALGWRRRGAGVDDLVATATRLTARSMAQAYRLLPGGRGVGPVDEVILCGGGARNETLHRMLAEELPRTAIRSIEEFGIDASAKEALSFAMLGAAFLDGEPANLPAVTGARRRVVLGQWTPAG